MPVLLLRDWGLWKSIRFDDPVYIGSPINAVRVFNAFDVDELIILDIAATERGRGPSLDVISQMTEGAFMPIAVGGGIRDLETVQSALDAGADRVVINTAAIEQPDLIGAAADRFGSQCVVASIDARRGGEGYEVFSRRARRATGLDPVEHARELEHRGAGEILLTSVDRDGTRSGYDLDLVCGVSREVGIPVVACGGAGRAQHFGEAVHDAGASAVAAGAAFLFFGPRRAVLINTPSEEELVAHLGESRTRNRRENPPVLPKPPRRGDAPTAAGPDAGADPAVRSCRRCLLDTSVPGVALDGDGRCNHCRLHDRLDRLYPAGEAGRRELERISDRIRTLGRGRRYDCVVGLSGGRDTSYCLHKVVEAGLRPLAVHFDNGWDSAVAKLNVRRLCEALGVDLHVKVADWVESRELTNCTLRACVPYIDMTDDVGIARCLFEAASRERTRFIILSHSFREEGINPLAWNYFDGRYFRALVKRFATIPITKLRNVEAHHLAWWQLVKGIRIVNWTNYYQDAGRHVEELLTERYGWVDTHQHHFDNELFALVSHYSRRKFGFDWRVIELSAKVRSGAMTREQARVALETPPVFETPENVDYCLRKQGISREEWERILASPRRYFWDYPNDYGLLKLFKAPIKWLGRANVLPSYVYEKYFET